MIIKYSYRTGNPVDTLFNARKKARECTFTDFDGYTISSTGHHILVWRIRSLFIVALLRRWFMIMTCVVIVCDYFRCQGKQMIPTFSRDGRMCAYVRDNNIWIRKFDFDTESTSHKDGELEQILNGITDWVYGKGICGDKSNGVVSG